MKTTIITLFTALGVSGLLLSAAAQPAGPPQNNDAVAIPAQVTPPDTAQNQPAQEQAAQEQGAEQGQGVQQQQGAMEQGAQDQGAMQQEAAGAQETAPDQTQAVPVQPRTITSTVIAPRGPAPQTVASAFTPPAQPVGTNQNDLNMNFVNAPLDQVLSYLSDAAGFIIVQQTRVNGYVTIQGNHITRSNAVDLLNGELNRNNYAAIRDGRILTIVNKSDAKTSHIPVRMGNDPANIPNNDEIATWIIPIRFVEARQLVSDLSLFVSPQATIVANEAGNSVVITDTQANIRHLAEIIKYVDNSAESETEIRVFALKYANPNDVASELASIFPSSGTSGSTAPVMFGGRGGRGGGPGGFFARMMANANGGSGGSPTTQQRLQKASQVTAVADQRTQSIIVSAPHDLMEQIAGMMTELDVPSERDQTVATIQLKNGDPEQVAQVLQSMFGSSTTSRGGTMNQQQNSALQQRSVNGVTTMGQTTSSSGMSGGGFGGGGVGGGGTRGGF